MPLKRIKLLIAALYALTISNGLYAQVANDTLSLSIEQLFARISRQHLQLAADRLKELMATERTQTARTAHLPENQHRATRRVSGSTNCMAKRVEPCHTPRIS